MSCASIGPPVVDCTARGYARSTISGSGWGRRRSPCELDLQLTLVALDLQLDLEVHLVGDTDVEAHPAALELDVVVAGEHVGEPVQPGCGLLAAEALLLLYGEDVHCRSFGWSARVKAMRASARTLGPNPSGMDAEGEAPGCWRATRTRSTPGRMRNNSGGFSLTASPSMPAGTEWSASTSNAGAVQSRHGRCGRRPPSPPPIELPATVIPSRPSSMCGRVPEPIARPSR